MKRLDVMICAAVFLLLGGTAGGAGADEGEFLEGTAAVGARYTDVRDELGRAGEYVSARGVEDLLPLVTLDLRAGTPRTLLDVMLLYRDADEQGLGMRLDTGADVTAGFSYGSFAHNLDHDRLQNLQARELVWNAGAGEFRPGGKQIYHTDFDPRGRYSLRHERLEGEMAVRLPKLADGRLYAKYDDQRRHGWRQATAIDHCAFCHISADRREVDEQTKTWRAGAEGTVGRLSWNYEYGAADHLDGSRSPTRRWAAAMHPVFGETDPVTGANYAVEFGSRLAYADVTLPYARSTSSERRSHYAGLKLQLPRDNTLRGSYHRTDRKNWESGVEGKLDAYAGSWASQLDAKTRLTARFLSYQVKVEDVFVDLPNWRNGRPGGGQSFDWTRISAANRDVWQTDVDASRRLWKGGQVRAGWRHQVIDRHAMAISHATYVPADGADLYVPAAPYANETTLDRFKLAFSNRYGRKGSSHLDYTYTKVDRPFMNPTAMCEEGLRGESHNLDGNSLVYYFQRQRYGNGTSLPSASHRANLRGAYQLSSRTSLSGFLTAAFEENDQLNVYTYERTVLMPGVNVWTAPTEKLMLTAGYTWSVIESNANLCPPIFDG